MKIYNIDKNFKLKIDESVINKMLYMYSQNKINETGGIILGKFNLDYSECLITDVHQINGRLGATPISFILDTERAQTIINDEWIKSEGTVNYVGEWHTHPRMSSNPSRVDINTMDKIMRKSIGITKFAFLIIIGKDKEMYIGNIKTHECLKTLYRGGV